MLKVKVRWAGFIGSPGWSNFYFDTGDDSFHTPEDAPLVADRVQTFLTANKAYFPSTLTWTIQSDVESLSSATGELQNVHSAGARSPIAGSASAGNLYSGASGIVVTWRTAGVRNGRRVRGRTFLVPVASNAYQADGTLDPSTVTQFQTTGTALAIAAGAPLDMGVWARPSTKGGSDGAFHSITSVSVPDMAAVLRSRRG